MERYTLDYMEGKFADHAMEAEKHKQIMVERYKRDNIGQSLPEYMQEEFSLPTALGSMVKEIRELRKIIIQQEDVMVRNMLISSASRIVGLVDDGTPTG